MSAPGADKESADGAPSEAALSAERAIVMADAAGEFLTGSTTLPMIQLVKRQICRPRNRAATDEELALFIAVCRRTKLDPFAGQICAVFRHDSRLGDEKMSIQTTIGGFRLIAQRTGEWEGYAGATEWCDGDGKWHEVWLRNDLPKAAKVAVWRKAHREPAVGLAHLEMFRDERSPMWAPGPKSAHMLAKCAEALGFRRAFPQELSGLYTEDEMARVAVVEGTVAADPLPVAPEPMPEDMRKALVKAAELAGWTTDEGLSTLTMNLIDLGATDTTDPVNAIAQLDPTAGEELHRRISGALDAVEETGA